MKFREVVDNDLVHVTVVDVFHEQESHVNGHLRVGLVGPCHPC